MTDKIMFHVGFLCQVDSTAFKGSRKASFAAVSWGVGCSSWVLILLEACLKRRPEENSKKTRQKR